MQQQGSTMNVQRSPTGCGTNVRLGGSQPNLDEISSYESLSNITQRNKRKELDDNAWIRSELSDLKQQISEMMALLKSTINTQKENNKRISEDITIIKNQVSDINNTIGNIVTDQNSMKITISNLQNSSDNIDKKIDILEAELNELKSALPVSTSNVLPPLSCEEIMTEINERNLRSKNIVIVGIPEPDMTTDRHAFNKNEVIKILKMTNNECPEPLRILRLGKFKPGHSRPIKVCFATEETAKNILRNKSFVNRNNIKIFSDQTPKQKQHIQNLKEELEKRSANGERNLIIKYMKGIPKIIKTADEKFKDSTASTSKN